MFAVQFKITMLLIAAAAVAQSVKHTELRSLMEVQLSRREFDPWSGHGSLGIKILATPSL